MNLLANQLVVLFVGSLFKVPSCIAPPIFVGFNTKGSFSASVASIDAHR
jgi:hypothetical protein